MAISPVDKMFVLTSVSPISLFLPSLFHLSSNLSLSQPLHLHPLSPAVDQSMFENSVAQHQITQSPRLGQPSARRATGPPQPNLDSSPSGGQQRLKNAINLGKAVGAKVQHRTTDLTTVMEAVSKDAPAASLR